MIYVFLQLYRIFYKNSIATNPCFSYRQKLHWMLRIFSWKSVYEFLKDDLFKDDDDIGPENFIKYVPDELGYKFCGDLARDNTTLESYLKSIVIPDVWKARLFPSGIQPLCTMVFYRNSLNLPVYELSTDPKAQVIDRHQDNRHREMSSPKWSRLSKQKL